MEKETINERLKQFIDKKQISTRQFEQKILVSNGLIARFISKNTTIQNDVLSKISDNFPELNIDWLITGKGEMLRHEAPTATTEPHNDSLSALISILQSTITEKDRQIQHLLDIIHSLTSNKIQ